jgi:hypothetical protein
VDREWPVWSASSHLDVLLFIHIDFDDAFFARHGVIFLLPRFSVLSALSRRRISKPPGRAGREWAGRPTSHVLSFETVIILLKTPLFNILKFITLSNAAKTYQMLSIYLIIIDN